MNKENPAKIVIPSYNRYDELKTLKLLEGYENITYIFVAEEEYSLYKDKYGDKWNVIIGEKGLKEQRNFITNYFEEGEILICVDDDICWFNKPLHEWIDEAVCHLNQSELGLMTFQPTTMYMKDTISYKEGNYFGIGALYILRNHKDLKLNYEQGEDFERTIFYLKKYGKNIRINGIYFRTKYFGKGGMESYRTIETYVNETNRLVYEYSDWLYFKDKKIMKHNLGNVNFFKKPRQNDIVQLGYYNCYDKLYKMFEEIVLTMRRVTDNRRGFPKYRGAIFGMVRPRFHYKGYDQLSKDSIKFPHIYEEINRIGKIICPFEWKTVQVNKNLVCPSHKDSKNSGMSLLVSFGEYEGCNIYIGGKKYDAKCRPTIFDGAKLEHYNSDDLVGTKYSLVYFI